MEKQVYYYAHSKLIYNTRREKSEERFLKKKYTVVNPNTDIGDRANMSPYLKKIEECAGVVFSEFKRFIGRGVYEEIKHAMRLNKPVLCLKKSMLRYQLIPINSLPKIFDEYDWIERYAKRM